MHGFTTIKLPPVSAEERSKTIARRRERVKFVFMNESQSPARIARTLGMSAGDVNSDIRALGLKKPKPA